MAKTRQQKAQILEELNQDLAKQKSVVLVDIQKLKFKDLSTLRKKLKGMGGNIKSVKKTLVNIGLKKSGFNPNKNFEGEVALVTAFEEPIKPIRSVYEMALKNDNLKILGGIFENKFIEKEEVIALAQLPTRKELLLKLVGSIASPISGFVNVLQGNIKGLVYILATIKK